VITTTLYWSGRPSHGDAGRTRGDFGVPFALVTPAAGAERGTHGDNSIHRSDPPTSC